MRTVGPGFSRPDHGRLQSSGNLADCQTLGLSYHLDCDYGCRDLSESPGATVLSGGVILLPSLP